jgi:hypothetical protein
MKLKKCLDEADFILQIGQIKIFPFSFFILFRIMNNESIKLMKDKIEKNNLIFGRVITSLEGNFNKDETKRNK